MELNICLLLFFLFFSNGTFPASSTHICEAKIGLSDMLCQRSGDSGSFINGRGRDLPQRQDPCLTMSLPDSWSCQFERSISGRVEKDLDRVQNHSFPHRRPQRHGAAKPLRRGSLKLGCKMSKTKHGEKHTKLCGGSVIATAGQNDNILHVLGSRREITRINPVCFLLPSLVSLGRESEAASVAHVTFLWDGAGSGTLARCWIDLLSRDGV